MPANSSNRSNPSTQIRKLSKINVKSKEKALEKESNKFLKMKDYIDNKQT